MSYVVASNSSLKSAARVFLNGPKQSGPNLATAATSPSGAKKKKKKKSSGGLAPGLVYAKDEGKTQALTAGFRIALPVFYPTVKLAGGTYQDPRGYRLTTAEASAPARTESLSRQTTSASTTASKASIGRTRQSSTTHLNPARSAAALTTSITKAASSASWTSIATVPPTGSPTHSAAN